MTDEDYKFEEFDNEDDIDQEEFKRISALAQKHTLKAIEKHIQANEDDRTKHIGDNVLVWDCSRLTDTETNEINREELVHKTLGNYPSIVIETDLKFVSELNTLAGDFSKVLDLVIWNKNLNKKFRTSSDFVKLHEQK